MAGNEVAGSVAAVFVILISVDEVCEFDLHGFIQGQLSLMRLHLPMPGSCSLSTLY
jgi:hypothetical protein